LPAELTAKGKTLLKRAEAAVQSADHRVLAGLTRAEQRELRRLLAAAGG
jgi:DNA-binding MarR family transcriptional regulator